MALFTDGISTIQDLMAQDTTVLATHRGRVLTRDQLLDAVWKETPFVTPRSIDVYIRRLREKIELDPRHPQYLKTLRGIGYRFEVPK